MGIRRRRLEWGALAAALLLLGSLLMISAGWAPSSSRSYPVGHPVLPPAAVAAFSHRDPLEGTSTPGMGSYHLVTTPLATPGCGSLGGVSGWLAYDHADRSVWAAEAPNCVAIVSNGSLVGGVAVGSDPFGVAVDPARDLVFVTNTGSDNVTVISDITNLAVAWIPVGAEPSGIAYVSGNGAMYVANSGSDNVSVIDDATLSVVGSVNVSVGPVGVAVDELDGRVYVANNASGTITVIAASNRSVVATLPAGARPQGVAWDSGDNRIFVSNQGSNNVTVIAAAADTLLPSIPAIPPSYGGPILLDGLTYDNASGSIWIGAGWAYAMELNASSLTVVGFVALDPSGMTYDYDLDRVCGSNTANVSLACFYSTWVQSTMPFWFNETGLPFGTPWSVTISSGSAYFPASGIGSSLVFAMMPSILTGYTFAIPPAAGLAASPSTGNVSVGSTPTTIVVTFGPSPPLYPVTFSASGLPGGDSWSTNLAGDVATSTASTMTFLEPNGTYGYSITGPPGLAVLPSHGTVTVAGAASTVNVTFSGSPFYLVVFSAIGLSNGTAWTVIVDGTSWPASLSTIIVNLTAGSHSYSVPPLAQYLARPSSGSFAIGSGPTSLVINVSWIRTYAAIFTESGLSAGAVWSVVLNGTSYNTSAEQLNISEPNGTYTYAPRGSIGATPVFASGTFLIAGAPAQISVPFLLSPLPLTANIVYYIQGASCGPDGSVTNQVLLVANVSGGVPPYSAFWTYPGGNATGLSVELIVTWPNTIQSPVVVYVDDSAGSAVQSATFIAMELPPCLPLHQQPLLPPTPPSASLSVALLAGLALALVPGAIVLWIGVRRSRDPPTTP